MDASFCTTLNDHPQTYTAQQGDCLYYLSQNKNLHGIYLLPGDLKEATNSQIVPFQACVNLGIKKDATGFYTVSAMAPQSALTPFVAAVKSNNSNFVYQGDAFTVMVGAPPQGDRPGRQLGEGLGLQPGLLRLAVPRAGWFGRRWDLLHPHDAALLLGVPLQRLPSRRWSSGSAESRSSMGTAWKRGWPRCSSRTRCGKALASGGTLNRASLLTALKTEHSFTARESFGPTDVGNHQQPHCIVMAQVKGGKWVRAYPSKVATFDCNPKNLTQISWISPGRRPTSGARFAEGSAEGHAQDTAGARRWPACSARRL